MDICLDNNWKKLTVDQFGDFDETIRQIKKVYEIAKEDKIVIDLVGGGAIYRN